MVLKIKLSHEQTVHEKGLSLYKNCITASVSLNCDKEAAASNSLPSSSSALDFIRIKKQSLWKKQCSGTFLYFYQLSKSPRSFLRTIEPYGLDCSFSKEQLILGG